MAHRPRKALGVKVGKGLGPAVSIRWALNTGQGFWRGGGARPHPAEGLLGSHGILEATRRGALWTWGLLGMILAGAQGEGLCALRA